MQEYLSPTAIIDSDNDQIKAFAEKQITDVDSDIDKAVRIYYTVRDGIWYDPYYPFYLPEHYQASNVLKSGRGYCVSKASLLCALGRACGIPSRLGFATVRNHIATRQLLDMLGSDLFVYHAYVQFYLENKWVIATPAFNKELCLRHSVQPLEFNGRKDSLFQEYNLKDEKYMEYITYHGVYSDVPVDEILRAWKKEYTRERVQKWIEDFEKTESRAKRNFYTEDVVMS